MFNTNKIFRNLFKNTSQRELDGIKSIIEKIGALEPDLNKISNEAFSKKTSEFKTKIKEVLSPLHEFYSDTTNDTKRKAV